MSETLSLVSHGALLALASGFYSEAVCLILQRRLKSWLGISIYGVASVADPILLSFFVLLKINPCCLLEQLSDAVPSILGRLWSLFSR